MANPLKGEVEFEAEGKTYVFRLGVNAICELEGKLGRGFIDISNEMNSWGAPVDADGKPAAETTDQIAQRLGRIRLGVLRDVIWAGLREHQPTITVVQAGEVIGAIGGMFAAVDLLKRGMEASMPTAADQGETVRPPVPNQSPAPGTGSASSGNG